MQIQEAIDHFNGIPKLANALGISYQAVQQWEEKGEIPEGRQYQIQVITKNKLKADSPPQG